jgi:F0F1-type ATP synthase assembly protein I
MADHAATPADPASGSLGLAYPTIAFGVSSIVSVGATLLCVISPVGGPLALLLVPRFVAALSFGAWAGWTPLRGRSALAAFLSFEAAFLILLLLVLVAVLATPHDSANLPFTSALVSLSVGDGLVWGLGWLVAARFRARRLGRS